jgi:hypothetical protein
MWKASNPCLEHGMLLPGFWEFLGSLNPLEVIRQYLSDRHRRRQDREYREREEERQLGLENDLREIELLKERLGVAREYDVPEEALAPLLQELVGRPLGTLGVFRTEASSMAARPRFESYRREKAEIHPRSTEAIPRPTGRRS